MSGISVEAIRQLANELHCDAQSHLGEIFDRLIELQNQIDEKEAAHEERATRAANGPDF